MPNAPTQIMIIRHGEKPTGVAGAPTGVTSDGGASADSLTVRGWTRAGALAVLFASPPDGLSRPETLICAAYPDATPHRVHQTLEPLAARLGQPILTIGRRDEPQDAVAAACAAGPQAVLLCWDHANIPALAAGVPTTDPVPSSWPEDRFDQIWIFEHWDGANYRFRIADQAVLSQP